MSSLTQSEMSLAGSADNIPRGALSVEQMLALMAGAGFNNESAAASAAGSWGQPGEPNYVTKTVAPVGGLNHHE
ncbi:hypothetical protein BGX34_007095 [Mortierella sp. NVP85]|nr:hypothetical protein BGX34_007095 [Mortierella sp. NVP85]